MPAAGLRGLKLCLAVAGQLKNPYLQHCYHAVFQIAGKFHWWSQYLRLLSKGLQRLLIKSLKNLQIIGLLITQRNVAFLMELQARYLPLFLLFSVIDSLEWLWMGSPHKNIQLMLEFLKTSFLALHFSYYMLITFLMMLYLILLSMLMIPVTYSEVFWAYCYLQNKCSQRGCNTHSSSMLN